MLIGLPTLNARDADHALSSAKPGIFVVTDSKYIKLPSASLNYIEIVDCSIYIKRCQGVVSYVNVIPGLVVGPAGQGQHDVYIYIYIYIFIERERERDIDR